MKQVDLDAKVLRYKIIIDSYKFIENKDLIKQLQLTEGGITVLGNAFKTNVITSILLHGCQFCNGSIIKSLHIITRFFKGFS